MAAGSGSRYGSLKQFDELGPNGEFLMEYSIYDAIRNDFTKIVLVTKKKNQEFLYNYLRHRIHKSIDICVVSQETTNLPSSKLAALCREKPWGTAHAVWCARKYISGDFAVINADDYYGKKSFENARLFFQNQKDINNYGLVVYKLNDTLSDHGSVSRGVCKVYNKKLTQINEFLKIEKVKNKVVDHDSNTELNKNEFVSMNFWLCRENFFEYLGQYIEKKINELTDIKKGEIYLPFAAQELLSQDIISINVVDSESEWFGVTYKQDKDKSIEKLRNYTKKSLYPSPLW
ncbi:MAG: UTP--glucose-1-phosphate uridylyltransferase [Flavobacteriaceae bacterium]|nr:UTP--glucose-1-phosphate uridylyltransferase [Flavobacteriaceae bacterium]|tara:strand:- start:2337 stop:3203 length:867 start_codon:yes stop_codon:yes gene_type:complete